MLLPSYDTSDLLQHRTYDRSDVHSILIIRPTQKVTLQSLSVFIVDSATIRILLLRQRGSSQLQIKQFIIMQLNRKRVSLATMVEITEFHQQLWLRQRVSNQLQIKQFIIQQLNRKRVSLAAMVEIEFHQQLWLRQSFINSYD